MPTCDPEDRLVADIRVHFPEEARITDDYMRERGWEPGEQGTAYSWVEAFADRITEAIRRRDGQAVRAQTSLVAAAWRAEPEALRTIVDVAYAENIMWDANHEEKRWAWEFIAEDIHALYCDCWGDPTQS